MTRVTISVRVTLLGLAFLMGACQGELNLRAAPGAQAKEDLATPLDLMPPIDGVSFADINRDMDQPILGCTSPAGACHGTDKPTGIVKLKDGFTTKGDMAVLMANYQAVLTELKQADPANSPFLLRPLKDSGLTHTGGKVFLNTSDAVYQRWLKWIQLGAKFEFVPFSSGPAPDLAPAPMDLANGGG